MGLPADRPLDAQQLLDEYGALVSAGRGEEPDALALRERLERDYPGVAPDLVRADLEIRRRRVDMRRAR
jgi:hypothetical protein